MKADTWYCSHDRCPGHTPEGFPCHWGKDGPGAAQGAPQGASSLLVEHAALAVVLGCVVGSDTMWPAHELARYAVQVARALRDALEEKNRPCAKP